MLFGVFVFTSLFGVQNSVGQSDFLSSQYMNSQLMINPAYAGVRNALNVNVLSRQQWMGLKDAPSTYTISAHTPFNRSMANIGGSLLHYQSGPIQQNELRLAYSYLVKVNHRMFLSLGLNASLNHYNVGLTSLNVIKNDDPSFMQDVDNAFKPNFGAGAFLFSPQFYVGLSMPQALVSKLKLEETGGVAFKQTRSLYLSSGYSFGIGNDFYLKPSFMFRYRQEASDAIDANVQFLFKDVFWVGVSYRIDNSIAGLFNFNITEKFGICYSYDYSIKKTAAMGLGSHELALVFETNEFLKRNRDRRFGSKKKKRKPVQKKTVKKKTVKKPSPAKEKPKEEVPKVKKEKEKPKEPKKKEPKQKKPKEVKKEPDTVKEVPKEEKKKTKEPKKKEPKPKKTKEVKKKPETIKEEPKAIEKEPEAPKKKAEKEVVEKPQKEKTKVSKGKTKDKKKKNKKNKKKTAEEEAEENALRSIRHF